MDMSFYENDVNSLDLVILSLCKVYIKTHRLNIFFYLHKNYMPFYPKSKNIVNAADFKHEGLLKNMQKTFKVPQNLGLPFPWKLFSKVTKISLCHLYPSDALTSCRKLKHLIGIFWYWHCTAGIKFQKVCSLV